MKKACFSVLLIVLLPFLHAIAQDKQPVDYADPMIGSSESRWMLNPVVNLPFGMVQLSPDNQGPRKKNRNIVRFPGEPSIIKT